VRTFAILAGATALSFAAVGAASAHHSFAMFDNSKKIDYRGVVKKLDWTNPHVWIEVVSGDGADQKTYGFEGGAVSVLKRFGWNATSFQVLEPGFQYWFDGEDACVAYVDTGRAWVAGFGARCTIGSDDSIGVAVPAPSTESRPAEPVPLWTRPQGGFP